MKEGFYLIYSQLDNFLKKQGVVKIEALNQQFNPKMHEAIEVQTDPNKEDGLIIEEFQKGYLYKDMVLRPSKVKVINNK
jgi:molecular chaperone GrpE